MENDNKLIAEFMGYDTYESNGYIMVRYSDNNERTLQDTHYHTSWDWLMPVVEKIESLGYTFEKNLQRIDRDWQCLIVKGNDILYQEFNTDSRKEGHSVVVEFINQYNN